MANIQLLMDLKESPDDDYDPSQEIRQKLSSLIGHKTPYSYSLIDRVAEDAPHDAGVYNDMDDELDRKPPQRYSATDIVLEEEKPRRPVGFEQMQKESLQLNCDSLVLYDRIKPHELVMCLHCYKPRKQIEKIYNDHAGVWKWERTLGPFCKCRACFCLDPVCGPYDTHVKEKQRIVSMSSELVYVADQKKREFEEVKSYLDFIAPRLLPGETIIEGATCPFNKVEITFCESKGKELMPPGYAFLTNLRLLIVSATAHRSTSVKSKISRVGLALDWGYNVETINENAFLFQAVPLEQVAASEFQMYQAARAGGEVFPIRPDAIKFCPCVPLCAMCPPEWGQWHNTTETIDKKEILIGCFLPPWQERCWIVLSLSPQSTLDAATTFVRQVSAMAPEKLVQPKSMGPQPLGKRPWNGRAHRPDQGGLAGRLSAAGGFMASAQSAWGKLTSLIFKPPPRPDEEEAETVAEGAAVATTSKAADAVVDLQGDNPAEVAAWKAKVAADREAARAQISSEIAKTQAQSAFAAPRGATTVVSHGQVDVELSVDAGAGAGAFVDDGAGVGAGLQMGQHESVSAQVDVEERTVTTMTTTTTSSNAAATVTETDADATATVTVTETDADATATVTVTETVPMQPRQ